MVVIAGAVAGQRIEVGHFPIIVHSIMIRIDSAQPKNKDVPRIVEVAVDEIAGEALKGNGAAIRSHHRMRRDGVASSVTGGVCRHQQSRSKPQVPNENI